MSLFDKILVPLDGSRSSARALEAAIAIAKKFNGEITLSHVYSVGILTATLTSEVEESTLTPSGNSLPPSEVYWVTKDAIRKAGANLLSKNEEMVRAKGISVEKLLKEGHLVQEIREVAKEGEYDLIVIGVKGISEVRETRLGSVSEKVIRNAQCPVLVIK